MTAAVMDGIASGTRPSREDGRCGLRSPETPASATGSSARSSWPLRPPCRNETVHTLGPLIHNPQAVLGLASRGVEVAAALDEIDGGTVIIRSHGVDPAIIDDAESGADSTSSTLRVPFVSAAHTCARELADGGYSVVIVGEEEHPEVEGIMAHAGGRAIVVQSAEDLPARAARREGSAVVVQTTQSPARLEAGRHSASAPRERAARLQHDLRRDRQASAVRRGARSRRSMS